jgi:pimeloyl-ACP methyl ester carboxylesterase
MTSKPTLVLVHGSWHTPACFQSLITQLETSGFICIAVALPSMQGANDLSADTAAVRNAVLHELDAGKNVVVVAHSYGGMPTSNALADLGRSTRGDKPSVLALVYLCAFLPAPEQSMFDALRSPENYIHDARGSQDFCYVGPPGPGYFFYNDLPMAEARKWEKELVPQSLAAYREKPGKRLSFMEIESWYLFCELDNAVAMPLQRLLVDGATAGGGHFAQERCKIMHSAHSPFLSHVEETAQFIVKAAAGV